MKAHKTVMFYLSLSIFLTQMTIIADERQDIFRAAVALEERAGALANEMFSHFRGSKGELNESEQFILFRSETFAASCHLFTRLANSDTDYFLPDHLRANLYNAFNILTLAFRDLQEVLNRGIKYSYTLQECQRLLETMERLFSSIPAPDNLAYLLLKYVKSNDNKVYLIEKLRSGNYIRRPFSNLESLWRYNLQAKDEKDPWKSLVPISPELLRALEVGEAITLTFDNCLVMDLNERPGRPVYLIQNGRKSLLTSPAALERYGGWKRVFAVPAEIITGYPEGVAIQ